MHTCCVSQWRDICKSTSRSTKLSWKHSDLTSNSNLLGGKEIEDEAVDAAADEATTSLSFGTSIFFDVEEGSEADMIIDPLLSSFGFLSRLWNPFYAMLADRCGGCSITAWRSKVDRDGCWRLWLLVSLGWVVGIVGCCGCWLLWLLAVGSFCCCCLIDLCRYPF